MSVDTTCCTVVLMDEHMNVLRPAIMWMDVRASGQAKRITATGHDMLKFNGYGNVSAETLWLKENERETYDKARYVVECTCLLYTSQKRLLTENLLGVIVAVKVTKDKLVYKCKQTKCNQSFLRSR